MKAFASWLCGCLLCLTGTTVLANTRATDALDAAEPAFLDYLDASSAVGFIESGRMGRYEGMDLADWSQALRERRRLLDRQLTQAASGELAADDERALAAMRKSLDAIDAYDSSEDAKAPACQDARDDKLDYPALRAALVACFAEHGDRLQFEGGTIDRGTALQLLHVVGEPARRKALFDAFDPLWGALNGRDEAGSPYRRMIAMAAADAGRRGSEIDAAARAIGVSTSEVERWLVEVLEAWRDANPSQPVEPWDYRYLNSAANRRLEAKIPPESLQPANERFFRDLGADPATLGVVFDLEPRPDKSPLAYTDFLKRGRQQDGHWRRPLARVLGSYPTGGLFSINELVHETGHAVHVSAIHTRPAYMDWPDTLFTEAFADVPAWSVHDPAWQRRYLGAEAPEAESLAVWTDITSRYLHIAPHPEMPWWAMRVQLVDSPGYMVNYGLGAVLTAELRARTIESIGAFDTGNAAWYGWLSERVLRFGSERDTRSLLTELLGRAVSPAALAQQIRRCELPR